jgi:hypothetical protein
VYPSSMTLEQGDAFEVNNVAWIRQNLPHYEPIWEAFIGHNGKGWPLEIADLTPAQEEKRQRFYQAHYSFAMAALRMTKAAEEIHNVAGIAQNYMEFETILDQLFRFASRMGQIRDMFKIMQEALCGEHIYEPLQSFYSQRSHVLHGPRLPTINEGGILCIPKIGGVNEVFGDWTSKARWIEMESRSFIPISDFVHDTGEEFMRLVQDAHGKVFNAASRCFGGKHVQTPDIALEGSWNPAVGMVYPAISACFIPPSGNFSSASS